MVKSKAQIFREAGIREKKGVKLPKPLVRIYLSHQWDQIPDIQFYGCILAHNSSKKKMILEL